MALAPHGNIKSGKNKQSGFGHELNIDRKECYQGEYINVAMVVRHIDRWPTRVCIFSASDLYGYSRRPE